MVQLKSLKKTKSLNKIKALKYFRKNHKETKEHNMIVDMERNDLSRICEPGSVKIQKQKTRIFFKKALKTLDFMYKINQI